MARTIEFEWIETDQRVVDFYESVVKTQTTADLTGVTEYRLQRVSGASFGTAGETDKDGKPTTLHGASIIQEGFSLKADLLDDIEWDVKSEFSTLGELAGPLAAGLERIGAVYNAFTGTTPRILDVFKIPRWEKTNPLSFQITTILYTRSNGILDVLLPAMALISQTAIKVQTNSSGKVSRFATPGAYLGDIKANLSETPSRPLDPAPKSGISLNSKSSELAPDASIRKLAGSSGFVHVRIPGLINLGFALMESCKPKWSRQITESGAPLWCQLEMRFMTTTPANSTQLFSELATASANGGSFVGVQAGAEPPSTATRVFS